MFEVERHNKFEQNLLFELAKQSETVVKSKASKEARKYYNMRGELHKDFLRAIADTKLSISGHGILYSKLKVNHKIEDWVIHFFARRFPMFFIVLESKRGTFVKKYKHSSMRFSKPLMEVIKKLEKKLPVDPILNELVGEDFQTLYYRTQYIPGKHKKKNFEKLAPDMFMSLKEYL